MQQLEQTKTKERADKVDDVVKNAQTLTPYEQLCDKVLQVSDQETLDKFIKNTNERYSKVGKIDESIYRVTQAFIWVETQEGQEFWSEIHYKVQELTK